MEIKDVENLAGLARIDLDEEEKKSLIKDFDSILAYVDIIKSAEPGEVEAKYDVYNVWREDLPRLTAVKAGEEQAQDFSKELITGQFPDSQDGFLKVKKIL